MRLEPDDTVFQINAVYLGPKGWSLPWAARYLAYGVGLVIFALILLVEALTPIPVGIPPVWELCIAIGATYAVMHVVDHDRPLKSVWHTAKVEARTAARAARRRPPRPVTRRASVTVVRK